MKTREHLIEKTVEVFQPLYDHPLKEEDALEIIFSVTEYFETLIGIDSQRTLIEEEKCEHDTG